MILLHWAVVAALVAGCATVAVTAGVALLAAANAVRRRPPR